MPINAKDVIDMIMGSQHPHHETTLPVRFKEGDRVKVTRTVKTDHTRVPSYLRGCEGVIVKYYGIYIFADSRAHGKGECPQALYSVRFENNELWGDGGEPNNVLFIDMYESYLEAAK
ncbi:SH3-like domain-containing protein [Rhodanobacter aciditrophus]|uniref:SH3-like domain-containing protein n=1 Tax=Rhodanobacter aciditrophus TaxID=1623218 RepID=A0ABW4B4M3_9GAMM